MYLCYTVKSRRISSTNKESIVSDRPNKFNINDLQINSPNSESSFEPSFASHKINKNGNNRKADSVLTRSTKGIFVKLEVSKLNNKKSQSNFISNTKEKRLPFANGQKLRLFSLGGEQDKSIPFIQQILSARNFSPKRPNKSSNSNFPNTKAASVLQLMRSSSNEKKRSNLENKLRLINSKQPLQLSNASATVKHSNEYEILANYQKKAMNIKSIKASDRKNTNFQIKSLDNQMRDDIRSLEIPSKFTNLIQLESNKKPQQFKTVQIDLFKPSSAMKPLNNNTHQKVGSFLNIYSANIQMKLQSDIEELKTRIKHFFTANSNKFTSDLTFYRIGKVLGKGAFGKVNLGMHKLSGKLVAIKSLNKKYISDADAHRKVMREISILKQLKHPNVMRLYETFETDSHILFITELCTGGDLLSYVRKRRKLEERFAKVILKQILDGLYYICLLYTSPSPRDS